MAKEIESTWRRAYVFWRKLAFGGRAYPIFRQELQYWDARLGGPSHFDEILGLLTLANLCLLPGTLLIFPGALLLYTVLDELIGLAILIPAAAIIVRERDAQTWSVLRATPLTNPDIVTGKLAGLLYLVWESASYLVRARWLGTILSLPLLGLMFTLPNAFPLVGTGALLTAGGLLLAYLAFIYRPLLNLAYYGCLGLAASTLAGSTSRAIALAVCLAVASWLLSGGLLAWYARGVDLAALFSQSVLASQLQSIFSWLMPLGLVAAGRILFIPGLFGLAVYRIERIAD